MAVVLVNKLGLPVRTPGGSVFVARNRAALLRILSPQMRPAVFTAHLGTRTHEDGDYWRVSVDNVYRAADEFLEIPQATRDYLTITAARTAIRELYGAMHPRPEGTTPVPPFCYTPDVVSASRTGQHTRH